MFDLAVCNVYIDDVELGHCNGTYIFFHFETATKFNFTCIDFRTQVGIVASNAKLFALTAVA